MKLSSKALELRGQFIQNYAASTSNDNVVDALSNPAILSGLNAFMQMVADLYEAGFGGNFDTSAKPERLQKN